MAHQHARLIAALRSMSEPALELLYAGGWPARLAHRCGLQPPPHVIRHHIAHAEGGARQPALRIAFASDFHVGATTHWAAIEAACRAIEQQRPDLLLLGGDFVSLHQRHIGPLARRLGQIPAPLGRFAVLGNHDRWARPHIIMRHLEQAGVQLLINENRRLPAPFEHIWVCGLDDADTGHPDARRALRGADGTRIILMHSPDTLANLGDEPFALALAGHTHGGQVALPSGRALLVPGGALCRQYAAGIFALGGAQSRTLIVSRGVGYSTFPFRAFAPADVVMATLR
ncbi:hypothetical protein F8S13_17165 [Chloroflexia bacterium SDU3-3]|nr:hypothetical protein F8S13_17165 [Chloroflexia bacterium SDU3-3]